MRKIFKDSSEQTKGGRKKSLIRNFKLGGEIIIFPFFYTKENDNKCMVNGN